MKKTLALVAVACLLISCSSSKQVTRLEPETVTDLSGNWNDTDSRMVAQEMITDAINRPWLYDFVSKNGRQPVVTVGTIRNLSSEHIDTEVFTKDFERELLNSGKVKFVASKEERGEVREERMDQAESASRETMKKLREETGADFLLSGSVKSVVDQEEKNKAIFYQTDLQLINIESNEKVWIGTKEIKKGISRGSRKW